MRPLDFLSLFLVLSLSPLAAASEDCQLYFASRTELLQVKETNQNLRNLSRGVNTAIKTSFDLLNKIDHVTYGLASAVLLGGTSLDQIKPTEWDKARLVGALVYQDQPFSMTPLKATSIKITDGKKTWNLTTGSHGEFALHLYELVPYKRLRLFPGLIIERGNKFQKVVKVPVTVTVNSPFCQASMKITELPLEPITIIASRFEK